MIFESYETIKVKDREWRDAQRMLKYESLVEGPHPAGYDHQ